MTVFEALDKLENTSSSTEKLSLLKNLSSNTEFVELVTAALDYRKKYFINKFESNPTGTIRIAHSEFVLLLDKLSSRQVTGNAAIALVESTLKRCTPSQAKWYARVLRRDLRAGFGVDAANKAGFNIPKFEVMLAKDGKDYKKLDALMSKTRCLASPKLDGYRCFAVANGIDNTVTLLTRNGEIYSNFPTIEESILNIVRDSGEILLLDGEIMSDDFNSMQKSAFASKRGTTVGDVKYHIFDAIPNEEYVSGDYKTCTFDRYRSIQSFFQRVYSTAITNLVFVQQTEVKTKQEILDLEKQYLSSGYEGVMVKPDIPYYMGRKTGGLMKFKTMLSMDCEVVDVVAGEGRNVGRMGAITVKQENNGLHCDVGTGFTDDDRHYIFDNSAQILGRIAEVKYQELTPDGIMRFPVFVRWRDKGAGKI